MIKKLSTLVTKIKMKQVPHISKKKCDKYGFVFLGLYEPDYFDDYLFAHTRAVFYRHDPLKNLKALVFNYNIQAKNIVKIRVGRSFIKYAQFKKFDSILDLITEAIEYNKMGRLYTIENILQDTPTSIYACKEATDKIIDSILEYPHLLDKFVTIKESKLKLIENYNLLLSKTQNQKI